MSYDPEFEQELTGDLMKALVALGYEAYNNYQDPLFPYDLSDIEQLSAVLGDYRQQWGRTDDNFILETAQRYLQDVLSKEHLWVLARDVAEQQGLVQGVAAMAGERYFFDPFRYGSERSMYFEDYTEERPLRDVLTEFFDPSSIENILEEGVVQSVLLAPYMLDELSFYRGNEATLGELLTRMRGVDADDTDEGETPERWRPKKPHADWGPGLQVLYQIAQLYGPLTVGGSERTVWTERRAVSSIIRELRAGLKPRQKNPLKKRLMR